MLKMIDLQKFAVDASEGLAATGTTLAISTDNKAFTPIAGIKTTPDIGADPETIDVTDLSDTKKKSVAGIQNTQNLAFSCVYKGSNFSSLVSQGDGQTQYYWKVTFPDGLTATFQGSFTLKIENVAVNGAMGFTITVVVSDGPDFGTPSAPAPSK
ncbi:phage tail tube protein [Liquorilactobacillus ghanensis]|nr:phage tail tube protein [Liquorilactobacillus ghanensis]